MNIQKTFNIYIYTYTYIYIHTHVNKYIDIFVIYTLHLNSLLLFVEPPDVG